MFKHTMYSISNWRSEIYSRLLNISLTSIKLAGSIYSCKHSATFSTVSGTFFSSKAIFKDTIFLTNTSSHYRSSDQRYMKINSIFFNFIILLPKRTWFTWSSSSVITYGQPMTFRRLCMLNVMQSSAL